MTTSTKDKDAHDINVRITDAMNEGYEFINSLPEHLVPYTDSEISDAERGFNDMGVTPDEARKHNEAIPENIRALANHLDLWGAGD